MVLVLLGSDRKLLKERVSGRIPQALTWIATLVMGAAAIALLLTLPPIFRH